MSKAIIQGVKAVSHACVIASCWYHVGIMLASCWHHAGVILRDAHALSRRVFGFSKRFLHCRIYPHSHPELELDLSFDRESRIADCASHWASTCPGHTGIILGLGGLSVPMPQNCPIILASTCLTYRCRPSSWHQPAFRVLVNRKTEQKS